MLCDLASTCGLMVKGYAGHESSAGSQCRFRAATNPSPVDLRARGREVCRSDRDIPRISRLRTLLLDALYAIPIPNTCGCSRAAKEQGIRRQRSAQTLHRASHQSYQRLQERIMREDDFDSERFRVEQVLDILEHAAQRLDARAYVPLTVVRDAVSFIDAAEQAADDAADTNASNPSLSTGLKPHGASSRALTGMKDALNALDSGDASAAWRFARFTREFLDLRREHLRPDNSPSSRRLFDRLAEAAAFLDIGASAMSPATRPRSLNAT
jgi:hypothetical protein